MRYTRFLLDADETVLDFSSSSKLAMQSCLQQFSLPYSKESYAVFKRFNDEVWREYERGNMTKPQLRVARFAKFFAYLGSECDPRAADEVYFDRLCRTGLLLPEADVFLNELKGRGSVYLITNGTTAAQKGRLASLRLTDFFDGLFISDELGAAKPHRAFFDKVLSAIGGPRENCVVIGDSLTSDIAGANNANLDCIWYNPHGKLREGEAEPTYTANSYRSVLEIIDRMNR